jgi:hypothetical protein
MPVQGRSRAFAEGRCEEASMEQRSATGGDHFVEDTYLAPQFGMLEFLRRLREDQLSVLVA